MGITYPVGNCAKPRDHKNNQFDLIGNADENLNSFSAFVLDEDIVNMYPIVKHINPRATDAYNFYTTGRLTGLNVKSSQMHG
jgi:hypothetical protein